MLAKCRGVEKCIISSLVCRKHMRKVKPDITIESGPEWMVTLFFAGYDLAFIQCKVLHHAGTKMLNSKSEDTRLSREVESAFRGRECNF